jgi:DNA repair exonuclease SbcCD nuclease subunit
MPSFRFLHAADLHLDTPFSGLGRSAPEVARALRDASLRAWDDLVSTAIAQDVAFVVLAGDLYDGADRGLRAQLRVLAGLRRLSDAGIDVLVVYGNHDPLDGWGAIGPDAWPERVVVCGPGTITTHTVVRGGERLATLHGISYATARTTENLATRFPAATGGGLHVGVLHGTVGPQPDHAPYAPCTLDDLRRPGYDYWALGHIHRHEVLATDPWVVYSGSLQGRSPKPAETGAKGAVLVDVVDDRIAGVEPVALDRVRFVNAVVDLGGEVAPDGITDLAGLASRLERLASETAAAAEGRSLVLRARLRGRTPVHADLAHEGASAELLADLRAGARVEEPFLWWESVIDETASAIDREALRERDDIRGALVRRVDALPGGPDALPVDRPAGWFEKLERELAREGLAPDPAAELRAAEALALDLLVGEEA